MKRSFDQGENDQNISTMANYLMLLSRGNQYTITHHVNQSSLSPPQSDRVFECKTCNRRFPSFQALGGHRASHKKPRISGGNSFESSPSPVKPKTHECSICGVEFAIGQALGGHMRRHRATSNNVVNGQIVDQHEEEKQVTSIVKRSNGRRGLCLDLNLTPYENDLELLSLEDHLHYQSSIACFS